jgi:glutathione S-transferase
MRLIIGNKNYSSWSLRPWLLLKQLGIPFEEQKLSFSDPAFKEKISAVNPVGKVPVLVDGDLTVWDSLAIIEYIAEKFPRHGVWPQSMTARARARSVCAEMHSGFQSLRSHLDMNCELHLPMPVLDRGTRRDVARICDIWMDCPRWADGVDGPFLFGTFSAADAYFAPIVRRFVTYDIAVPAAARRYVQTIDALPSMKEWMAAALAEDDFYLPDEQYRDHPPPAEPDDASSPNTAELSDE